MRQIRKGVFETNSSSMHSLVIRNEDIFNDDDNTMYDIPSDYIMLDGGTYRHPDDDWYFGRYPFKLLSTFEDKWRYACANNYDWDDMVDIFKKYVPECKKVVKPKYLGTDDCQLSGWLQDENIELEEFLTNNRYIVVCDGDEYCIWDNLKISGVVDIDVFREVR